VAPRKDATRPADDAAAAAESSGSGSRPTLGRLSTSSSAPDLQKLAAEGGAGTDGADGGGGGAIPQPDILRLSAGAAVSSSSSREALAAIMLRLSAMPASVMCCVGRSLPHDMSQIY
jgi:hypothetical protein